MNVLLLLTDFESPPLFCRDDEFSCTGGGCVPLIYHCDNANDCEDESDEQECPHSKCPGCSFFHQLAPPPPSPLNPSNCQLTMDEVKRSNFAS